MDRQFIDRYAKWYSIIKKFISPVIAGRANFSGEKIPDIEGPKFILCNHNTDFDFMLLISKSDEPLDFVATESMLRMNGISKFAAEYFKPILHDKGSKGAATIKQIVSRIKEGRNVVLFPEGNRSFDGRSGDISEAIGKIAKMTGATLVVYKLTGGYLTTPRWGSKIRKGHMEGVVTKVIDAKTLKEMPPDVVRKEITEGLYTDAYKEQGEKRIRFKSKTPAEYLESLLFICPSCKKIGTLSSNKNRLSCGCGYQLIMDEFGYLHGEDGLQYSVTEMFDEQKKLLEDSVAASKENCLWSDKVRMMKMSADHRAVKDEMVTLLVYRDRIMAGEESFSKEKISSIDIVQRNRLMIHIGGEAGHLEFVGEKNFNAVKYRLWL